MSSHVILFGSTGMLGNTIKKYFKSKNTFELICISRKHFDILNSDQITLYNDLYNLFKVFPKGSIIINAIGLIPHTGNKNDQDYLKINAEFPKLLDQLCNTFNCKFIHITTDCVFNGLLKNGGYKEDSIKDEEGIYGKSKALGEELTNATVIRTSIIGEQRKPITIGEQSKPITIGEQRKPITIGEQSKPIHLSLLEWVRSVGLKDDKTINGFTNHYWNGVTCLRLAQLLHKIVEKGLFWKGVSHIFSNIVSKYQLIKYINEIYKLNINIIPTKCEKTIDKTLSSNHITNTILNEYTCEINIYEQIKEQMEFFKNELMN
jgi:dTDP-4-dehydrorhamnose reductase